jgi:hypothetical protein
MIRTEWLRDRDVIAVHPVGAIEDADFTSVAATVDPVIAAKGRLEGLLIHASGFDGWDDARALLAHLRFVNTHVSKVARIAVVGDQWWLRAAPTMESFVGTSIQVFADADLDAAKAWLLDSPPVPASITFLPESDGALIAIRVTGRLRDADYQGLEAELAHRLPATGKLRLLVVMDEAFRGWTPKACFDDIALAFAPWTRRLDKLAVVSGPGLVYWFTVHFPSAMMPYEIRAFTPEQQGDALGWLRD